jgi:hypothetical protein
MDHTRRANTERVLRRIRAAPTSAPAGTRPPIIAWGRRTAPGAGRPCGERGAPLAAAAADRRSTAGRTASEMLAWQSPRSTGVPPRGFELPTHGLGTV